jgi:hypothetical protein
MDSLPTGSVQSWFIVAAVALIPLLVFATAEVICRVLPEKWRGLSERGGIPRADERECQRRRAEAPPVG